MILLLIGSLLFAFSTRVASLLPYQKFLPKLIRYTGILLVVAGISTSCFKQINAGEVGIQVLFGKVQPGILESGLHLINPLLEIEKLDIKTQNYTMSAEHSEGDKIGDDAIRVLSAD